MSHSPCHHQCDWTDEPTTDDLGCCSPYPVRKSCEAPVIPVPNCGEEAPVVTYDEDTEEFIVTTTLYDENCSAILDSDGSPILTLIV